MHSDILILPHFPVSKFYPRSFTSLILGKFCLVNLERSDTEHVATVLCVTDAAESHLFPSLLLLARKGASLCLALSQGLGNLAAEQSYTRLNSQQPLTVYWRLLRKTGREAQPWLIYREDSVLKLKGSYFWQYAKKCWRAKIDMVLFVYPLIRNIPVLPSTKNAHIA